jgi:hypothetical protein
MDFISTDNHTEKSLRRQWRVSTKRNWICGAQKDDLFLKDEVIISTQLKFKLLLE